MNDSKKTYQFEPDVEEEDDDDYEIKQSPFKKFLALLMCRSDSAYDTFAGAEDSIRVGLKKGISSSTEQKKARSGSMYVPRASMPVLDFEENDDEVEKKDETSAA